MLRRLRQEGAATLLTFEEALAALQECRRRSGGVSSLEGNHMWIEARLEEGVALLRFAGIPPAVASDETALQEEPPCRSS
ncbi:MAG: Methane monooxygenase, hydrolase gamma chain [Chloroflexi bacterium]|jgi:hypothetical protein|nr:Methane monooxygenase, hydrolase gamma chain [Chloroflexota bacterium]